MSERFIEIEFIDINTAVNELLIASLEESSTGFEEGENFLKAYFDEDDFNENAIIELAGENKLRYKKKIIEKTNWNKVWESNFQPVIVDDFAAVRADFHQPITTVLHEIIITPKMSFGTGHHATTYMMMEQMKDIDFTNKTVFDFGTGTGILAILAEKLGASSIVAIDVDGWSIENTKENIEKNHCAKIEVSLSSVIPTQQFEIILANINRNVILDYLPQLKKAIVPKGYILLSGLLATDEQDIVKACEALNWQLLKQKQKNNWISLLFKDQKTSVV
jgi:ribosomal protein L11 methyltransferase